MTAEEKGLLGSEYYARQSVISAGENGGGHQYGLTRSAGPGAQLLAIRQRSFRFARLLIADAKEGGLYFSGDPHPESGGFFRSDHFSFAKRGVPALSFESGDDLVNGGKAAGEAARKDYIAHHYHQPSDEWQASWTFAGMSHDLGILYKVGSDLANSDKWPNWSKDSEFRATRDASAAERK